jgi:hypothetical protein
MGHQNQEIGDLMQLLSMSVEIYSSYLRKIVDKEDIWLPLSIGRDNGLEQLLRR